MKGGDAQAQHQSHADGQEDAPEVVSPVCKPVGQDFRDHAGVGASEYPGAADLGPGEYELGGRRLRKRYATPGIVKSENFRSDLDGLGLAEHFNRLKRRRVAVFHP